MNVYKIYFYDRSRKEEYPLTVTKKDINELCKWLNRYTFMWQLEVISGHLLDNKFDFIDEVEFLPSEITTQYFITSLSDRLIAYNELVGGL